MNILGLETSCDETAAAVVTDGLKVRSNVISSQIAEHAPYGGVVPELASRRHLENILPVLETALAEAGMNLTEIDYLAATRGPGLVGALLVGLSVAKALAMATGLPLIGVDHLQAHVAAAFLEPPAPKPPLVALIVSGGHTSLVRMRSWEAGFEPLARTLDDAAGEAFDKVGKLLGLAYPAGPIIDRLAAEGRDTLSFPRPMLHKGLDFSFSGLKTAVLNYVRTTEIQTPGREARPGQTALADICASFQAAVVEVLVRKTVACAKQERVEQVILAGGVAANSGLRSGLGPALEAIGVELIAPPMKYCTDNAAMVAAAGYHRLATDGPAEWSLNAVSKMSYARP